MCDETFQHIRFQGLDASLRVVSPDVVRPLLDPILAAWPVADSAADEADTVPFATLRPIDDRRWSLEAPLAAKPVARHNPINAICDLVVEMSWERLRSRPDLLCLHAAALTFGDRLVIFPNARRAGKSLLSAALSRLGHQVFSDDFVPLQVDKQTQVISGMANGIAPRLRVPLPDNLPAALSGWITDRIGPTNKQYGYLTGIDLPQSGTTAPLGAVVVLDRDPHLTTPPTLTPISQDEAMAALVTQNFGRQVHSGAILRVAEVLTRSVPVLRLRYNAVEQAAALLHDSAALRDLPAAQMPKAGQPFAVGLAPLDVAEVPLGPSVDLNKVYAKLPNYTEVTTETGLYLADGLGVSIHRLNPVSMMIWKLLDAPFSGKDIADVLQEVFPDTAVEQLRADITGALQFLVQQQLIKRAEDTLD